MAKSDVENVDDRGRVSDFSPQKEPRDDEIQKDKALSLHYQPNTNKEEGSTKGLGFPLVLYTKDERESLGNPV